jgi:hypothetical protein
MFLDENSRNTPPAQGTFRRRFMQIIADQKSSQYTRIKEFLSPPPRLNFISFPTLRRTSGVDRLGVIHITGL